MQSEITVTKALMPPVCPYCHQLSEAVTGTAIYPKRRDLKDRLFYRCVRCDAYVGSHQKSGIPFGRLANKELRLAKQAVHAAFDPLWKRKVIVQSVTKKQARSAGYKWLAEQLKIPASECHIGMFDLELCGRALTILSTGNQAHAAPSP
jgi:hypothetical protein